MPDLSDNKSAILDFFSQGGEMGALIQTVDWTQTPLGAVENWPQSLRTAVSICLFSRFPILIWWGPEFVKIYNDAYRPMLGLKHPQAMGQRGQECWAEIWDIIGPMLNSVYYEGKSTWSEDQMLPLYRKGFTEECYFTFSYSPIFVETGQIGGIFTAVSETTQRVLGERRLQTLRKLGENANQHQSAEQACQVAAETLVFEPNDVPFALLYLVDEEQQQAYLAGEAGLSSDSAFNPEYISLLNNDDTVWPLAQVSASNEPAVVQSLERFGDVPNGPWPEKPHTVLILPITAPIQDRPIGFIVAGVSTRLTLDSDYQSFYQLVAGHIGTAVANARAFDAERQRAEALAKIDRAKTVFFNNISHEFRTPLTLMLGPLEDLLNNTSNQLNIQSRQQIEVVNRNSLRLLKLVNTLLDFSRIEAGRIEAVYKPTDLATYTAELASIFRSTIEHGGLSLLVNCPPLPEMIYIDRDMWEKIVFNLLSNAFKFTLDGEIEVGLEMVGEHVELSIRDTGVGIPAAELPNLFERFFRVPNSQGRTYEGSGIGLALVDEFVTLHGGSIRVDSEEGLGSTFTISLPRGSAHLPSERISLDSAPSSNAPGASSYLEEAQHWLNESGDSVSPTISPSADSEETGTTSERPYVLLADDNADMRLYIKRLLSSDYEIKTVLDGVAALDAVHERIPDLILSDVMMPKIDGFELMKRLHADPRTSAIPIILLSARAGEEAQLEGIQAGADDYLVKPFSALELVTRVQYRLKTARDRQNLLAQERIARDQMTEILESMNDAFYALDNEDRFTYVNRHAMDMWQKTADELLGKVLTDVFPMQSRSIIELNIRKVKETRQKVVFEFLSQNTNLWYSVSINPSSTGLAVYFHDIMERKVAEERATAVQNITAAFSEALTPQQVAQVVVDQGLAALDAFACVIALVSEDGKKLQTISRHHISDDLFERYAAVPIEAPILIAHAVRLGRPIWITSFDDYAKAYPEIAQFWSQQDIQALVAIPLVVDGKKIGVISFSFRRTDGFDNSERTFILTIAQHCAQALERARLAEQARIAAAVGERQRLARDLHDTVSQAMFSATTMAQAIPKILQKNPARAMLLLEQVVQLNRSALSEMRSLLLELRPEVILKTPLNELLSQLIDAAKGKRVIIGNLTVEGDEFQLPPEVHVALYRIMQESINNILKHSEAKRFQVTLQYRTNQIILQVEDNGRGFDLQQPSQGIGLSSMRERAEAIKAALEMSSAPDEGTKVSVVWQGRAAKSSS